jgi:hypothetical protein
MKTVQVPGLSGTPSDPTMVTFLLFSQMTLVYDAKSEDRLREAPLLRYILESQKP